MNDSDTAGEKLKRIQILWKELVQAKASDPKCEKLMKQIRTLSQEYLALTEGKKKPKSQ